MLRRPMREVRVQYFLLYGVLGAVLPYASVFFRDAGLTAAQVGFSWAIWSGAAILAPVLITYVADTRVDPRRLIALCVAASGASLLALGFVNSPAMILFVWAVHCLTVLAAMPVLDGLCFSVRRMREARGEKAPGYHRVRVWGTVGFILPSVLLFVFLYRGMPVRAALMSGALFAAVAAVQALRIRECGPTTNGGAGDDADEDGGNGAVGRDAAAGDGGRGKGEDGEEAEEAEEKMPTAAAVRALFRPGLRVFCCAMFLVQMATAMHGGFYPIYLTERAGVAAKWVGLIANVGVVAEIFFMLAMGRLTRRLGFKGLFLLGIFGVAARLGLLALFVSVPVAVGTQVFHGLHVVAMFVLPQTLVDRYAEDRFRHSMQGVFGMFTGTGRVIGSLLAGWIGGAGAGALEGVMGVGASLALAAAVMVILGLRRLPEAPAPAAAPAPAPAAPAQRETGGLTQPADFPASAPTTEPSAA